MCVAYKYGDSGGNWNYCTSNSTTFSQTLTSGVKIGLLHLDELNETIRGEEMRKKGTITTAPITDLLGTRPITAIDLANLKTKINAVAKTTLTWPTISVLAINDKISADHFNEARTKMNAVETECICNCNYCSCDGYCNDCGCDYCANCTCQVQCTCVTVCTCHTECVCDGVCSHCACNTECACEANYACTCNCNY